MLTRNITYENIVSEETVTEKFYFNLSRHEIVEMQFDHPGGLQAALERMVKAQDLKSLMAEMKKIILSSYGVKSEDGRRFMKNDELRNEFIEIGAYDSLFMEFATDEGKAAEFVKGIIPKGFAEALAKAPDIVNLPSVIPPPPKE